MATNNPSGRVFFYSAYTYNSNPSTAEYVLQVATEGFATANLTGRFTISSSNLNGLDKITFP